MNTFYNILTFNFSHTLPKKQFLKYNILPVCVILLSSIHDLFAVLFFPSILIILFIFSLLSLYRLNDTGVNIIVSFILILTFILLISAYFAINFPTSSYSIEWEEDAGSSLYKIAVYKRDLIIRIYYIYTSLFMLMLFILPSSKNKKENIIHKRNKFFKKLQYIYITYFIYPLFRCFKYKKHYKMSSKTFFYFWILIIISIILYFLITSFYTVSLLSLRDIISNFTGGEFEDKNLGFGIVMFLSLAINGMLFLLILLIILGGFTFAFVTTDIFRSNKYLFLKYLSQIADEKIVEYYTKVENNPYQDKGNFSVEITKNGEELESLQYINNFNISYEGKVNIPENKSEIKSNNLNTSCIQLLS